MDAEADHRQHSGHIAILPNPGAGHLPPLVEFTRRLLLHNPSLSFTFLVIPSSAAAAATPSILSSLPASSYDTIALPPPSFHPFSDLVDESLTRILRSVHHSLPSLRQALLDLMSRHVTALVVDIFATDAVQVAAELGIKPYIFVTSSAISLSVMLAFPEIVETTPPDKWSPGLSFKPPGCPTLRVRDMPEPAQDPKSVYYEWVLDQAKRYKTVQGIISNSFDPLERGPLRALVSHKPPIYAVGPLVRTGSERYDGLDDASGCLRWLDEQPTGSVLYVSFGSGGTLSTKQVTELAWGLELSEQRFIWVVRSPNDTCPFGTYLSLDEKEDPLGFLPKGFVERTRGRGLVVKSWAPQAEVLSHGSTCGFMTHCGWNSILEGAVNGVGFIAWPLYAEQKMNAVELVEDAKVALRVERGEDGIADRDEIARVVKVLMEGEEGKEIKARMKILKEEAKRAVNEGGSSDSALSELALMWKATP